MNEQDDRAITPFAVTDYRDERKVFGIRQRDRRSHMYMIGKTGTGKSTLILNMLVSDIRGGRGAALIDPHGDLAEEILNYVPENRIDDVIYFNPADLEYPVAFNPLEKVHPDYHHLVASGLISVFKKIWPEFWGPRLEHILRNSILTLLEYPDSSLLDLPRLLTDKDFRTHVLRHVNHQQVREFWFNEFEKYSAWLRSEAISPILNKVGQFLTSPMLRNIVGQKENTFDLRKVMNEGKILIVNLSKGKVGEDNSALLGAMLVTKIMLAALSRADIPENERIPFYLYVDEFHNFLTLSFANILTESRKYNLNLILAHQYIEQLDEKIMAAVFGNVGTIISFRVGAEDAKYLAREFHPVFDEADLANLPNYHIYLKLMIDGVTSKPFSAETLGPYKKTGASMNKIIDVSRTGYGKPRTEVEKEVLFAQYKNAQQGRLIDY
ncbi:MAG: type IV secretion system DNA-binding domain-containing protein [Desulfobacteraceae bacterium]|nr:type IV secretion system DNA-binding domain-containing protein [Desulfobacteraceae bacterium]